MLFYPDPVRYWEWTHLWVKHIVRNRSKADQLTWDLFSAECFRSGFDDDLPEDVRALLGEKAEETDARILQAVRTRDTAFLRSLYDAALGKRSKLTITAHAVMALPQLWDEKWKNEGRKPTWEELRDRMAERRKAAEPALHNPRGSDKQWDDTRKELRSIL